MQCALILLAGLHSIMLAGMYIIMLLKQALLNSISVVCTCVTVCVCVCCSECMVYFNLLALKYKACMIIIVVNSTFSLL